MDIFIEQQRKRKRQQQLRNMTPRSTKAVAQSSSSLSLVFNVHRTIPHRILISTTLLLFITLLLTGSNNYVTTTDGFILPKIVGSSRTTSSLSHNAFILRRHRTFHTSSSSSLVLQFARTDVPHPDASDETYGIPYSATLPPLYGDGFNNKPKSKILPNGGKVTLVGSGPGDPNLLTVSAYKLLTGAKPDRDVIIVDRLVSSEILDLIPNNVNVKIARKMPGCAELAQEEIYWWSYQNLNKGKHIIRLKIGDPFVFGRGGEEILQYRKFGVEPIVIPGVSSAFSAPLLGNIPVTHRGVANQVVMCTGYGRDGTSPDIIQYHKEQTVVFLMAVGRLQELCNKLRTLAHYPSDTPVAIVEKAGCPTQRTVVGDLTSIAGIAQQHNIQAPSTIIVGNVVNVLLDQDDTTGASITGLIQNATMSSSSSII